MSILKPAENQMAFAKIGIFGAPGSGKTFTATELAIGLSEHTGGKPIAFFDTETGSDFIIDKVKSAGIELLVHKSRAFVDLTDVIIEAQDTCSVLIIDSITHVWRELCDSYRSKLRGNGRLQFQDWAIIKGPGAWQKYTDLYINSPLHIIACGRAGFEYDYDYNQDGSKDLVKTGTKMKVETEFGFEPSLMIEMERLTPEQDGKARKIKVGSKWIHRGHILKDRTDTINGESFDFPGYKDIEPHFAKLNIGGDHVGLDTERTSDALFKGDEGLIQQRNAAANEAKQREIALDEIKEYLTKLYPGTTSATKADKADKAIKAHIIELVFGTPSWKAVESMPVQEIVKGSKKIKDLIAEIPARMREEEFTDKDAVFELYGVMERERAEAQAAQDDLDI